MRAARDEPAWPRWLRRIGLPAAGLTLVGIGLLLLVTPGPGLLTLAGGLGVLSAEFPGLAGWRDTWMRRIGGWRWGRHPSAE